jgi:two-component system sensor histidine kinase KdpD
MREPRPETSLARRTAPFVALILVTAGLVALRGRLDKAHIVLVYLLVVLGGSAAAGRGVGLALAFLSFLCFNFFLLPPYHTLELSDPRDWLILLGFLVTSVIATDLLTRVQRSAALARRRAEEIDRLALLGAESLSAGRAEEAVAAIARMLRSTLGLASCEIHVRDPRTEALQLVARATRDGSGAALETAPDPLLEVAARRGLCAIHRTDGTSRVLDPGPAGLDDATLAQPDARALVAPLLVRGRVVGVLRLAGDPDLRLDPAQRRFAETLSYYAALAAERVRLVSEAEHAEALREADRLKDALIASVSHDLRTPLTTIKALAHDLREKGTAEAAIIEEEADRLNRFVTDLLDLSRLDGGGLRMAPELVAAEDLLGAALQRVSGMPNARAIQAHLESGDPILVGRLDFVHALRALVNLLENALKYSPPGSPVDVSVAREGSRLALRVRDRGPGVPAHEQERIFEPFFRGGTHHADGGVGLGLPIARRLARAQGGDVVYAPREGGGSEFTLFLPAADFEKHLTSPLVAPTSFSF